MLGRSRAADRALDRRSAIGDGPAVRPRDYDVRRGRERYARICLRRAFQAPLATVDYDEIGWQKATLVLAERDCG